MNSRSSTMNDDPREVLAILNSLGFVGITAQQLKAFMKDLKLYRKIKDRERQQRKEEIKRRIIERQQNVIKEVLREQKQGYHSIENTVSSDTSNSYTDNSLVKVKVKCASSDKENKNYANSQTNHVNSRESSNGRKSKCKGSPDPCTIKSKGIPPEKDSYKYSQPKIECPECFKKDLHTARKPTRQPETARAVQQKKPTVSQPVRPMSAPNVLEHKQEPIKISHTRSTSSTRNSQSGSKSFIRPWKLQPEAQKGLTGKKSDPVTLYQKYQQEWKQMSFPGEAKHSGLRWSIREKMLGGDPHPIPLPKKSASMPALKKKRSFLN